MTAFSHTAPNGGVVEVIPGYGNSPTASNAHAQRMTSMTLGLNDGSRPTVHLNNGTLSITDARGQVIPLDRRNPEVMRILETASSVFRNTQFVGQQLSDHPQVIPGTFAIFDSAITATLQPLNRPAVKTNQGPG